MIENYIQTPAPVLIDLRKISFELTKTQNGNIIAQLISNKNECQCNCHKINASKQ